MRSANVQPSNFSYHISNNENEEIKNQSLEQPSSEN